MPRRKICKGRYEILNSIFTGGMGEVYLAIDSQSGMHVAVKTPRRDNLPSRVRYTKRLREESEKLRLLKHENIVKWINGFNDYNTFYLIEELVRGGRMRDVYDNNPASTSETIRLMKDLIETVHYLHRKTPVPIIHGDINPMNILIRDEGQKPVIIDFGIATRLGYDRGVKAGMRPWAAPEQLKEGEWHFYSDIYGLGATMFFLLTGQEPPSQYDGHNRSHEIETTLKKLKIPPKLTSLVVDSLKIDPRERIENTENMLKTINNSLIVGKSRYDIVAHIICDYDRIYLNEVNEIGRVGHVCTESCREQRRRAPNIQISGKAISRHHAKIFLNKQTKTFHIEDMNSRYRTAISRDRGETWQQLARRHPVSLKNGDIIVLGYRGRHPKTVRFVTN